MVFNKTLPVASMKLTPHRLTLNFSPGESARSARQHSSRALTHCPAKRPSTLRVVRPRFFSVVILSIDYTLCPASGCRVDAKGHQNLLTFKLLIMSSLD